MTYVTQRLGDLCNVRIGRTPRRDSPHFWGGSATWVTVRELNGGVVFSSKEQISDLAVREVMQAPIPEGTLLFSFKLSIGKMAIAGIPLYTNEAIAGLVIRDANVLDRDYLRFALMATSSEDSANHAVLGKVLNKEKVEGINIPVPSLVEQHRIVDILSRAEGIVRLRREAEKKAAELIPALFLDMFGDPATNPKRWDRLRLEDVCEISYGIADKLDTSITSEQGIRILTISNILLEGIIDPTVERYCLATDDKIKKCSVQRGDLLFNWRNGSESHIGKTAIWESDETVLHVSFLLRLRPNAEKLNSHFLWTMINLMRAMGFFIGASRQQINRKFNASELSALELPIPPKELQDQFTHKIEQIRSIQSQQTAATAKAQATFDALLAQVFRA